MSSFRFRSALVLGLSTLALMAQGTPKRVLFDHTRHEEGGVSAEWVICSASEPTPLPAHPTSETDWNGALSSWAVDLDQAGYVLQTLPPSGRVTYGDATNAQDLSNYQVYAIVEPYTYFSLAEKQAIVSFVQHGGGLFIVGNHLGATRVTSSVPGSTDAYHVFNDLLTNNGGASFGFTFVPGHGPGDSLANTTSTAFSTGTSPAEQAIIQGPNGALSLMDFHSYAYISYNTAQNPNVKEILHTGISGDTGSFIVTSTLGTGRVVAISDSSPADDGTTTTAGKSLHNSYWGNSNRAFFLNATAYLAGSGATAPTLSASITTPAAGTSVVAGSPLSFQGSASISDNSALSYGWAFGDGATASVLGPVSHSYSVAGTYTATFTATSQSGQSASATRTITVTPVANPAPTPTCAITTPSADVHTTAGAQMSFQGSASISDGSPLSYAWTFGDGATATSLGPITHAYTTAGTYAVTFTATSNQGMTASATRTVTVTVPTPPPTSGTFLEQESNNTLATANLVASSYTAIQGNLTSATDVDYFALTLQPGQTLRINMTGPTGPDWDLYLKNAAGTTLTSSTGSTTTESLSYTNNGTTTIRVYPEVLVYNGTSSTPYTLALTYVTPAPAVTFTESEPNDSIGSANRVPDNATKCVGYIGSTSDNDYFAVTVGAGRTLKVDMTGPTGSSYDYDLYFYDASGAQLASSTGSTTTESTSWTNTSATATTVVVSVQQYAGSSTTLPYTLALTR